jgi:lipopolysaccharide biosynthesis regulator YciM
MSYKKTGTEVSEVEGTREAPTDLFAQWEILGELAQRLHHTEEAKDAFQRCLDSKFSAKAWMKLLEMYSQENDLERALNAAIRLTTYQQR